MSESHKGQSQIQCAQSKPKGKATGERIPGYKYQLIVEAAGREEPVARIARQVGVDRATATAIIQRESRTIQQRKQELLDQSLRIARRAANEIERKINDKATLNLSVILVARSLSPGVRGREEKRAQKLRRPVLLELSPGVNARGSCIHSRRELEPLRHLNLLPRSQTRAQTPSNQNH